MLNQVGLQVSQFHFSRFIIQLLLSAILGTVIACHYSFIDELKRRSSRLTMAKAQILLCITGSLLVIIIGNNVARAFAIFGIGSFFRFRTPVKNMLDSAMMFFSLGIGMVVGLGLYVQAAMAAIFIYGVLAIMALFRVEQKDVDEEPDAQTAQKDKSA